MFRIQMAILSHSNSKTWMDKRKRRKAQRSVFSGRKSHLLKKKFFLTHSFWKLSSSYSSHVLTFVSIGYRKLTNCSKLQHSEMIGNPVIHHSHFGKITATTQSRTYFPSPRGALYNQTCQ